MPAEKPEHGINDRGDGPLDDLVADMPGELRDIVRGGTRAPGGPQKPDVVEHALVPARVLANHAGRRLGHVHQLEHRHRPHEYPARAQRVAEGGVFRGTRGRKAPEALQCVQPRELVVAETDLRSAEAELEEGTEQTADAR